MNRISEGQDSARFKKRSECKKKPPGKGPFQGPEGGDVMFLSTGEVGTRKAQSHRGGRNEESGGRTYM